VRRAFFRLTLQVHIVPL